MPDAAIPPPSAAPADDAALPAEARTLVGAQQALLSRVAQQIDRGLPIYGHLRVHTRVGRRDVLLSDRSLPDAPIAVIDWRRAPLAEVFFEAREGEEYDIESGGRRLQGEVEVRALLAVQRGRLVGVLTEDHALRVVDGAWAQVRRPTPVLLQRPARDRGAPASPMVTVDQLDPHQRRIAGIPAGQAVLVLGEAGYGKTTVALHRALELSRARKGPGLASLVIVPTEGLRRLTELALDRFEAKDIEVQTFDAWVEAQARAVFDDLPRRTSQASPAVVSRLKRHPALAPAIEAVARGTDAMRELDEQPEPSRKALAAPGTSAAKSPARRRGPPKGATRRDLLHLFGDSALLTETVDRAGGAFTRRAVDETLRHTRLQFSKTTEDRFEDVDPDRLRALDGRRLDEGTPTEDADSIDPEDFAVLFELTRLRTGRDRGPAGALRKYAHVIVDEAHELAPIELSLIGRAVAQGGSLTVAGDEHQALDPGGAFAGWDNLMAILGRPEHHAEQLVESYRCPPGIEALARRVVGRGDDPDPGDGSITATVCDHDCHRVALLCDALLDLASNDRSAMIAIVTRTAATARQLHEELERGLPVHLALRGDVRFSPGIQITCVDEVRGLEFDYVVLPDANPSSYPESPQARRALYVALTRARTQVWMLTTSSWSPLLPDLSRE